MKNKIFTLCLTLFAAGALSLLAQNNPTLPEDLQRGLGRSYVANNIGDGTVTIDGIADEAFWSSATTGVMDTVVGNKWKTDLTPADFSASFKIVWDASFIYLFVSCVDDTLTTGAGTAGDNIEFFFNVDSLWYTREKNDSESDQWRDPYRANKNFTASQIRVNPETTNYTAGGFAQNTGNLDNYEFASNVTATGWDIEVRIPYEMITTTSDTLLKTIDAYTVGAVVHFEVSGGDVDRTYPEGEQRQHIINWNSTNPDAWKDVRHFGRLVLGPNRVDVQQQLFREFRMFPTLVTDHLTVELMDNFKANSITVVNMLGQQLMRKMNVERVNIIPMSELPAGIYILNVESANGSVYSKKFVKKN